MKRLIIPIKLSNPVMSMASWTKRQGEVTSHSRSYGEELQRSIFVQIASAIGDLESVIGIITSMLLFALLDNSSVLANSSIPSTRIWNGDEYSLHSQSQTTDAEVLIQTISTHHIETIIDLGCR